MTRLLFVACTALVCLVHLVSTSEAAFFLTGAQVYAAKSNGAVDPAFFDYRFTTNSPDNGGKLTVTSNRGSNLVPALNNVNLNKSISFGLDDGETVFSFSGETFSLPTNYLGLNLFFTDEDQASDNTGGVVDNTYNPSTIGVRAGDISVVAQISSPDDSFAPVTKDQVVQNYMYVGYNFNDLAQVKPQANGSLSFVMGDKIVTVTGFTANNTAGFPAGSFKLTVTATPEPSTIGMGALAFCGLAGWVKKRRGKKQTAK